MEHRSVFAGMDYHQASVQVSVRDAQGVRLGNRRLPNDERAIAAFVERYGDQVRAALESCSGAAALADHLVQRPGWSVRLGHPGYIKRMKHNPDKSDYSDADLAGELERLGFLPEVWLAPPEVRELRRLVRFRQVWVDRRRTCKQRILALLRDQRVKEPAAGRWSKAWLTWLRGCQELGVHSRWIIDQELLELAHTAQVIAAAEKRLQEATRDDALVQRLQTFAGIGPVTAWVIRAEIGRFDRFRNGKQLARFCGLSPRNASSGQRQADAGLIHAGNPLLRTVLIEAGHRLMRYDPHWREFAQRLLQAGKPKSLIAAAVSNRWVRKLFYEVGRPASPAAA